MNLPPITEKKPLLNIITPKNLQFGNKMPMTVDRKKHLDE
jgi:hypothetical protein